MQSGPVCDFQTSYKGIVAPLAADLYPAAGRDAQVWVRQAHFSEVCVAWRQVPTYISFFVAPRTEYTMVACLRLDGSVGWFYEEISPVNGPPNGAGDWLVGVRDVAVGESPSLGTMLQDDWVVSRGAEAQGAAPQVAIGSRFETLFAGDAVREGNSVQMCAVDALGCVQDACGPSEGGNLLSVQWRGLNCGIAPAAGLRLTGNVTTPTQSVNSVARGALVVDSIDLGVLYGCEFGGVLANASLVPVGVSIGGYAAPPASVLLPSPPPVKRLQQELHCVVPPSAEVLGSGVVHGTAALHILAFTPQTVEARDAAVAYNIRAIRGAGGDVDESINVDDSTGGASPAPLPWQEVQMGVVGPHWSFVQVETLGGLQGDTPPAPAEGLVFTYEFTDSGGCGCFPSEPGSQCSGCGVCVPPSAPRQAGLADCAGTCFGDARVNDCGICTGGASGNGPLSGQDCAGECFGSATDCPTPSPTPTPSVSPSAAATPSHTPSPPQSPAPGDITSPGGSNREGSTTPQSTWEVASAVVLVALITCSSAMLGMCAYFVKVHLGNQRRREFAVDDAAPVPRGLPDAVLNALEVVTYHPGDNEGKAAAGSAAPDRCTVCLVDFEDEEAVKKLPCGHVFHAQCVDTWLQTAHVCPLCKFDLKAFGVERGLLPPDAPHPVGPSVVHPAAVRTAELDFMVVDGGVRAVNPIHSGPQTQQVGGEGRNYRVPGSGEQRPLNAASIRSGALIAALSYSVPSRGRGRVTPSEALPPP